MMHRGQVTVNALSTVLELLMVPDTQGRELVADEAGNYFRGRVSGPALTELAVAMLIAAVGARIEPFSS
jgi:hypothetical protein